MNRLHAAALLALLAGLGLLAYGATQGDVRVGLFLIIPFVYGTGLLPALGMLLLIAAGVLWFLGLVPRGVAYAPPHDDPQRETRHGGVILLGPIPIIWGNDRRILPWMIAAGLAMLALTIIVMWMARAG